MMQAGEPGYRNNFSARIPSRRSDAPCRSLLIQAEMSPVLLVITDVFIHEAFQMPLIEYDYMVEQIAATVADESLCDAVLPGTAKAGLLRLNAETLDGVDYLFIELCAAIKDQVAGCRVVGKCFA